MSLYKDYSSEIPAKPMTNKCIVLDLDETLVHSYSDMESLFKLDVFGNPEMLPIRSRLYKINMDDVVYKKGTGIETKMWGITRPHLKEFLVFCFSYFGKVIVWSAGKKKYVHAITDFIFRDVKRPHAVYTYDDCEKTSTGLIVKPLRKMIDNVPGLKEHMSLKNAYILDDRKTVYSGYEGDNPNNGIQIPRYKPQPKIEEFKKDDNRLIELKEWLEKPENVEAEDVRTLDKNNIFE